MKSSSTKVVVCALIAVLTASLAGCTNSTGNSEDRPLVVGASAAPNSMDPSTSDGSAIPQALLYNVYETLLKVDGQGGLQPLLASEWQVSPDSLTYTFTLRPHAKFSSGAPVDADAVVASMERIIDNRAVLPVLKSQMEPVESVTAIDADTVEFVLKRSSQNWLFSMSQRAGIIYEPSSFDDLTNTPVGSGPFVFEEWVKGDSLVLTRNANYWGTPTKLAGITFKYYTDANAMNAAMLSGSLDVLSDVAAPQALDQFDDPKFKVYEGTTTGEVVLGFNHDNEVLSDLAVPQAINHAIDREALLEAVWGGKGMLIGSMVPPTDPWFEDLSDAYPYDPEKAKSLLEEAGYSDGDVNLRMRVPTLPYAPPAATYISSQLKEVGISVQVDELEFPATWIEEVMQNGNYDMTIVMHAEARDMDRWANPEYYWHYDNAQYRQLLLEADASATEDEQIELMKQAGKILSDDAVASFLWLFPNLVVTKSDITGINENATSLSFDMTAAAAPPQ